MATNLLDDPVRNDQSDKEHLGHKQKAYIHRLTIFGKKNGKNSIGKWYSY